jgi:hypothetical protein
MRRSPAIALLLLLLLVPLVAWWLLREDATGGASHVLAGRDAASGPPGFADEVDAPGIVGAPSHERTAASLDVPRDASAPEAAGRVIAGRTLRTADRSPLPGILLVMPGAAGLAARSGADGAFRFEDVPEGAELLAGPPRSLVPVAVPLPPAGDVAGLEVVLDSGWIQPGIVRDEGGGPLAGATVGVALDQPGLPQLMVWEEILDQPRRDDWLARAAVTGADGSFRLLDLPTEWAPEPPWDTLAEGAGPLATPDADAADELEVLLATALPTMRGAPLRLFVVAHAEGWSRQAQSVMTPDVPLVASPLAFELQRGGAVAGRVTDPLGVPRAGIRVGLAYERTDESAGGATPGLHAVTGDDGRYLIDGVPPATYVLAARAVAGPRRRERRLLAGVEVRAGETTTVDLVHGLGATLEGVVLDAAGQPVAGADVQRHDRAAWPGGSGGTSLFHEGSIRVSEQDGVASTEILQLGEALRTDGDGRFRFAEVGLGSHRLLVSKRADPSLAWAIVDVEVDAQPPPPLVITLSRALRLGGRVVDEAGEPLQDVLISLAGSRWPYAQPEVVTGADGRFTLGVEAPGDYALEVLLRGYVSQRVEVALAGDREDLVVRLARAPVLRLVVLDALSLEPVTAYEAWLIGDGGMETVAVHQVDGSYRHEGGGTAPLTVQIHASGYVTARHERVLARDTEAEPLRVLLQRE